MGRDANSGAYLGRSLRKKLASTQARESKVSGEEEPIDGGDDQEKVDSHNKEIKPVVIDMRKGGTSHNCPAKDAAGSHPVTMRCIRGGHLGVCRVCKHLVSAKYGCKNHKNKGDNLQYSKIKLTGLENETPVKENINNLWPWQSPKSVTKKDKVNAWWKDKGKGLNDPTSSDGSLNFVASHSTL